MNDKKISKFSHKLYFPITLFFLSVMIAIALYFLYNGRETINIVDNSFDSVAEKTNYLSSGTLKDVYISNLKYISSIETASFDMLIKDIRLDTRFLASLTSRRFQNNISTLKSIIKEPDINNIIDDEVSTKLTYDETFDSDNPEWKRDLSILSTVDTDLVYSVVDSAFVDRAFLVSDSGIVLTADNDTKQLFDENNNLRKTNVIGKKWYRNEKVATESDIYYDYDLLGDGKVLTFVYPFLKNNIPYGIVGQEVDLQEFHKELRGNNLHDFYITMIMQDNGEVIYCSDYKIEKYISDGKSNIKSYIDDVNSGKVASNSVIINDEDYFIAFNNLESTEEWYEVACINKKLIDDVINKTENLVNTESTMMKDTIYTNLNDSMIKMTLLVVFIALVCLSLFRYMSNKLTEPLDKLSSKIDNANVKELTTIEEDTSSLELNRLSINFNDMINRLNNYINEIKLFKDEKEQIKMELDFAKRIQQEMLPQKFPSYPDNIHFDLYAINVPEAEIGGDFYDFLKIGNLLYLIIADVSGSGIAAALFMAKAKTLLHSILKNKTDLTEVISTVNKELCDGNSEFYFVTVGLYCINLDTKEVTSVNAGHEDPIIIRRDNTVEVIKECHAPAIATDETLTFTLNSFRLEKGDILFLYTDGVVEAINKDEELYGISRLTELLKGIDIRTSKNIVSTVKKEVFAFSEGVDQYDDITMMCYRDTNFEEEELYVDESKATYKIVTDTDTINVEKIISAVMSRIYTFLNVTRKDFGHNSKDIELSIEEELANIIDYAYTKEEKAENKDRLEVIYSIDKEEREIRLEFIDGGKKFNPLKVDEPNLTPDYKERKVGGLGVFLIKTYVDEVTYDYVDNKNHLVMIKKY